MVDRKNPASRQESFNNMKKALADDVIAFGAALKFFVNILIHFSDFLDTKVKGRTFAVFGFDPNAPVVVFYYFFA